MLKFEFCVLENEEEHQHVRDIKVVKEKPDGILKNSKYFFSVYSAK